MSKSIDEQIQAANERLKTLRAQKAKSDALKRAKQAKVERKKDTRRKILAGAVLLADVNNGEFPKDQLIKMLDRGLSRDDDRELFDLPPKSQKP